MEYSKLLEKAVVRTVEEGIMTKDLALVIHGKDVKRSDYKTLDEFMEAVKSMLHMMTES